MKSIGILVTFAAAIAGAETLPEYLTRAEAQETIEQITQSPRTLNRIELLHLGKTAAPARAKILAEAEHSVLMSTLLWYSDSSGEWMRDLVAEKKRTSPSVDMKLYMDWSSAGLTGDLFAAKMSKQLKSILGSENFASWNTPWSQRTHSFNLGNNRAHDKFFIVDGKKLIMGGMNVANDYFEGGLTREGWHDTDMLIEGPLARQTAQLYLRIWKLNRYLASSGSFPTDTVERTQLLDSYFRTGQTQFTISIWDPLYGTTGHKVPRIPYLVDLGDEKVDATLNSLPSADEGTTPIRLVYDNPLLDRVLPGQPYYSKNLKAGKHFSRTMQLIAHLMKHTGKTLDIFLPYLTPETHFIKELVETAKSGVRVRIITNSEFSHDVGIMPYTVAVGFYRELLKGGVEIFEWQGHKQLEDLEKTAGCQIPVGHWPGRTIHTKGMVFDGAVTFLGSHNFNVRSERLNSEVAALVEDKGFADQLSGIFENDLDRDVSARKILCGGDSISRPALVEQITLDILDTRLKKFEKRSKLLKHFRSLM